MVVRNNGIYSEEGGSGRMFTLQAMRGLDV